RHSMPRWRKSPRRRTGCSIRCRPRPSRAIARSRRRAPGPGRRRGSAPRSAMASRVVPIAEEHIASFRAALDDVARERRFLIFLEAPPLEEVRAFVRHNIRKRNPAFVALAADEVIGWCDVVPLDRSTRAHTGTLGLAVTAPHRGRGVGTAL